MQHSTVVPCISFNGLCRELVAFDKLPLVILYGNGWLMLDSSPCQFSKVSHRPTCRRSKLMRKNEEKSFINPVKNSVELLSNSVTLSVGFELKL